MVNIPIFKIKQSPLCFASTSHIEGAEDKTDCDSHNETRVYFQRCTLSHLTRRVLKLNNKKMKYLIKLKHF